MNKLLLSAALVTILSIQSFCVTDLQLITSIRVLIEDPNTDLTKQTYSTTTLLNFMNDAQLDIVCKTRCLEKWAFMDAIADQGEYLLPTDYITMKEVQYSQLTSSLSVVNSSSTFRKLERCSLAGLDNDYTFWQQLKGQPLRYFISASSFTLNPMPNVGYSGTNRIKMWYFYRPANMDFTGKVPFDNNAFLYPYHDLIKWYTCARIMENKGNIAKAQYFDGKYYQLLNLMTSEQFMKEDWQQNLKYDYK